MAYAMNIAYTCQVILDMKQIINKMISHLIVQSKNKKKSSNKNNKCPFSSIQKIK